MKILATKLCRNNLNNYFIVTYYNDLFNVTNSDVTEFYFNIVY